MSCRALVGALSGLLIAIMAAGQSSAAEPTGTAVKVDPAVNASGTGGQRLLAVQGAVFMGDEIVASPEGLAQIKFIDDTKIVIGPNSRLKIDTFVFNPDNTAKKVAIDAIRGSFRFISGNSAHEAYSIRTPTMTIGVRGTVVDISVGATESSAVFAQGSGEICNAAHQCVSVDNVCQIWVVPQGGQAGQSTGIDQQRRLAYSFPFLGDQSALEADFQVRNADCGVPDPRIFGSPADHPNGPRPPPPSNRCEGDCGDDP